VESHGVVCLGATVASHLQTLQKFRFFQKAMAYGGDPFGLRHRGVVAALLRANDRRSHRSPVLQTGLAWPVLFKIVFSNHFHEDV
jgi:hypothetical protein